jgi:hypothetical protein
MNSCRAANYRLRVFAGAKIGHDQNDSSVRFVKMHFFLCSYIYKCKNDALNMRKNVLQHQYCVVNSCFKLRTVNASLVLVVTVCASDTKHAHTDAR